MNCLYHSHLHAWPPQQFVWLPKQSHHKFWCCALYVSNTIIMLRCNVICLLVQLTAVLNSLIYSPQFRILSLMLALGRYKTWNRMEWNWKQLSTSMVLEETTALYRLKTQRSELWGSLEACCSWHRSSTSLQCEQQTNTQVLPGIIYIAVEFSPHLVTLKMCRVEFCTEPFHAIIPSLFLLI